MTTKATHQINVDNADFHRSNRGRDPRGFGSWAVKVSCFGHETKMGFFRGSVPQARQQAAREFIAGVTFEPGTHNIVTVAIQP